jgi:ABC-type nitrate/sulfonate/bicarbonate transport system ATPase subunit
MRLLLVDVTKDYSSPTGTKRVLSAVDLEISRGEVVAVVGPNGSGKSTLVGIAAGVVVPTTGKVHQLTDDGNDVRPSIALLWQNYRESNFPWLDVLDNVALSGVFAKGNRAKARARAAEILIDLLPEVATSSPVYRLSGGQQQIVAMARALASEPEAVLADEALSALDQARNWVLISKFESWWLKRRVPVLWVSHNLDEAIGLADRIALLSGARGEIVDFLEVKADRPRTVDSLAGSEHATLRRKLMEFLKGEEEWRLKQQKHI